MKTFKVIICALFILCCGAIFSACNEKNFNENKIVVGESQFVYDGKTHMIDIEYKGAKPKITYSLNNKKNFKPLSKFNFVDAGTYKLYYRLSLDGYNTYTSKGYLELKIAPKELEVSIFDYKLMKSSDDSSIFVSNSIHGLVEGDDLGMEFTFGEDFDRQNVEYGDTCEISCTISNPNYELIINRKGTLTVADFVEIEGDDTVNYYPTLQAALEAAEAGETIKLNNNIYLSEGLEIDKSITIDGQGYHIIAEGEFVKTKYQEKDLASVISVFDSDVELTLLNVTVNGSKVARGVSMFNGMLILDLATVTEGARNDDFISGGVYVASDASFAMNSGYIGNNDSNDNEHTRYASDLYIQTSTTTIAAISNGSVDNVFVDACEGKLTLSNGQIYNIYLEYKETQGATFEFVSGEITNLLISTTTTGQFVEIPAVAGTTYVGGTDYSTGE